MSSTTPQVGVTEADLDAIRAAALDYLEGYVSGDAKRHLDAYHPEAIKRRYRQDPDGVYGMVSISPQTMADYAVLQTPDDSEAEVVIDGVYHDIATVRVYSERWVDFLHVVKARGVWKLLHVTWYTRDSGDA
jgi:hypothetical protein